MKIVVSILSIIACSLLNSCIDSKMREITARNSGTKFWLYTPTDQNKNWEYRGAVDELNRANGFGSYNIVDTFYGGNSYEASGKFVHGQPNGDHSFRIPSPLIEGRNHYLNGQFQGTTKTQNEMPQHLANVATLGLAALVTSGSQASRAGQTTTGLMTTDVSANYPEGVAYDVTTYGGQYATDRYSFITIFGMTTYASAKQNLEAGRSVYGGDKSDRPGYFWIDKIPVRQGSQIRTGVVGVR